LRRNAGHANNTPERSSAVRKSGDFAFELGRA
jgi:hypothetical protein